MKRLLFVALALIVAGSAVAEDQFGLWRVVNPGAWNEAWLNYIPMEEIVGAHDLYVVLHDRSEFNLGGYELGVEYPAWALPINLSIPNGGINLGDYNDHLVGYNIPLVSADFSRLVVSTLTIFVGSVPAESGWISYRAAWLQSIPEWDGPCYAAGYDFTILVPCGYWNDDPNVFLMAGVIGTESATWTGVKSLFT
jgi:hypothetical protein